ncbi:RNA polymerase sigma-70 factor [uncultured Lutibacter sp.]|uniref:RNA polymerase sigma factor n=1 Tax=uncultured Lutibacter sp. TaxID=437739 RepID=UPI00262ED580|nr:RNA polymerase sigma-70 factor [uncultured Lutibacter sp.]
MKKDFSNNKILIKEFKKGNEKALNYIVETYHHRLCLYIYSLSNDYDGAKDSVQNVFMKLWEKRSQLPEIKSFKSYLYKAAYNDFLNQIRGRKETLIFEKIHIETIGSIESENSEDLDEKIKAVKSEIENLPPKCKEIFLMSKQEGLTYIEISEHLNISLKTVEGQMLNAFKKLKSKLGNKINLLFLIFDLRGGFKSR